ncbi:hypothetical protein GJU40_19900 [Bacillus lacus]|uniref:Uncharacterized protein n=1 Tax=Metabacillus lacus TaxID=1983721 RepID=A0A7X2J2R2_9BACI|nr:DUF6773 family protein [Metabacillus lacus]MRX74387.1 hypothetical protein [Metabacillus lacus]
MKSKIVDERVYQAQNKIYREIYILIMVITLASIVYKYFTIGVQVNVIATELIILLSQAVYYLYRSARMGIYSAEVEMHDNNSKMPAVKKNLLGGTLTGIGISLFFGFHSALSYADTTSQALSYFFLVFFISLIIYIPFFIAFLMIPHLSAKRLSEKAEEDELKR